MDLASLLERFSRAYGFPPIPVSGASQAQLRFSGDLTVDLEWRPGQGGLHLTGVIQREVPDDPRLLRSVLQANAPRAAVFRTVLSIDADDGALLVSSLVPESEVDESALSQALEAVLEAMEQWRQRLANDDLGPADTTGLRESPPRPKAGWNLRA